MNNKISNSFSKRASSYDSQSFVQEDVNKRLSGKVVTKISLLKNYCPAEEYHQKYLEKR